MSDERVTIRVVPRMNNRWRVDGDGRVRPAPAPNMMQGDDFPGDLSKALAMCRVAVKYLPHGDAVDVLAFYDARLRFHYGPSWDQRADALFMLQDCR